MQIVLKYNLIEFIIRYVLFSCHINRITIKKPYCIVLYRCYVIVMAFCCHKLPPLTEGRITITNMCESARYFNLRCPLSVTGFFHMGSFISRHFIPYNTSPVYILFYD